MGPFRLKSKFKPAGDQPQAIAQLVARAREKAPAQCLLGVTGSGKSLAWQERVWVYEPDEDGARQARLVPIGELIDAAFARHDDQVIRIGESEILRSSALPHPIHTLSLNPSNCRAEAKPITALTRHRSPKTMHRVTSACGRGVTVTGDHNFYALRDGRIALLRTEDLATSDYLPVPVSIDEPVVPLASIALGRPLPQNLELGARSNGRRLPCRLALSDALLSLIGFYVAEGHAEDRYFLVSAFEREQREQVISCIEALGLKHFLRRNGGDVQVSSLPWSQLFANLCGRDSRSKRLPPFWTRLSDAQLATILRSYFSADGGVDGAAVTATTASRVLAEDLAYAAQRLGIWLRIAQCRKRATNSGHAGDVYFKATISGQPDLRRFGERIGFCLDRKRRRLEALLALKANTNVDVVPISPAELKKARQGAGLPQRALAEAAACNRSAVAMVETGKRRPSRDMLASWLTALNGYAPSAALGRLLGCRWSPVRSIEAIPAPSEHVYDFTVEDNETFLAGGGLFVHNTFTAAHVIQQLERPTLVISPNKVLAAQLYSEFKSFFPENAVEFFISYYDYYQPEAYVPSTDTYIEKDSAINDRIDRLRLKATSSLLARRDVIVVASVSCIYNIGAPENYRRASIPLEVGWKVSRSSLIDQLVAVHYERNETEFTRGKFRVKGAVLDVFPAYMETALRVELGEEAVAAITEFDPLTGANIRSHQREWIYPAKHFVTEGSERERAVLSIRQELDGHLDELRRRGKPLEARRLEQRTKYDLEMLREIGFCKGIENYSRHLSGRPAGERPFCLIDFFPKDSLLLIDESHVTIPQIRGMYEGDRSRKQTLVDFGFRLPSALDNRPLKFHEFEALAGQTIFVSATPGPYELQKTSGELVEQVIRPTGLVDPEVIVHPTEGQMSDLMERVRARAAKKERTLVTTLTKRTAEDLTSFLVSKGLRVRYLHSDIESLERIQILQELRLGKFDCLVGINLLREGLDLPEVSLVAILGADHEGFLRSETTLIQISGRAARNVGGEVVLYADERTGSMERALGEMDRRRVKQLAHNETHGIKPRSIQRAVLELEEFQSTAKLQAAALLRETDGPLRAKDVPVIASELEQRMKDAAENLDFELAAALRDQLFELREMAGPMSGGAPLPKRRRAARK